MKKHVLTVGLLLASLTVTAQPRPAPAYTKKTISRTDIQFLTSLYTQTGNHSAVTGGIGTEELVVFSPELSLTYRPDSSRTLLVNAGVDVVTSASTDRIDYVLSSASRVDSRLHLDATYSRRLRNPNVRLGVQAGVSAESDYLSLPVGVSWSRQTPDGSRRVTAGVQAAFDDLRWGRLNPDYFRPVTLIYPVELRNREWFTTYRRTSVNVTTALYQIINRKTQVAFFPELTYQQGLLSTPFHRAYFADSARTVKVENLPGRRWRVPLGVQINWFAAFRVIVRAYYRYYQDSYGIAAHTLQLELPIRLTPFVTLSPVVRVYRQTASRYFRPYAEHDLRAAFYTSDYDLSAFSSYKLGLTLRYAAQKPLCRGYIGQSFDLRYTWYRRSDQLSAHTVSLLIDLSRRGGGLKSEE